VDISNGSRHSIENKVHVLANSENKDAKNGPQIGVRKSSKLKNEKGGNPKSVYIRAKNETKVTQTLAQN